MKTIKFILSNFVSSYDFLITIIITFFLWVIPSEILLTRDLYILEYSRSLMNVLGLIFTIYLAIITFNREIINKIYTEYSVQLNSKEIFKIFKISIYLILINIVLLIIQDLFFEMNFSIKLDFHYKFVLPITIYNLLASFSIVDTIFSFINYEATAQNIK